MCEYVIFEAPRPNENSRILFYLRSAPLGDGAAVKAAV